MSNQDLKTLFIRNCFHGDKLSYRRARREDYFSVQLSWTAFLDGLCRNGIITEKQFYNASF